MKTFQLTISSPSGNLFEGEAVSLSVRGTEGDLAVMAGHIPFITKIVPSNVFIELPDGTENSGETDGGLLTVSQDKTILLSGTFNWK